MRYLIDEHTRERMEERKITDAEIDATIRKPDGRYHDPKGQVVFFRMIDGRIIHVCMWKNRKPMTTRTTWYE